MMKRTWSFLAILLLTATLAGCGSSSSGGGGGGDTTTGTVVFSDVHFDPFYDTTLFDRLVAADASEWAGIFATSATKTASTWGRGTNYPLLLLALAAVKERQKSGDVVIFTGDILRHSFDWKFYELYGMDVDAMQAFADKTVAFFVAEVRSYLGDTPVLFALGNNDAYEDYDIEPDGEFLENTAELFYTDLLKSKADHQTFLDTYKAGGYYSAEPLGTGLVVLGLNTVYFSTSAEGDVDDAANAELVWLDAQLAAAKAAGKKVWLLMHVPPGGNIFSIKDHIDSSGHITSAKMMWNTEYQTTFLSTLATYADTIVWSLAGHTHMDEYRLPSGALELTPAISPVFSNDPAFKVFTVDGTTFGPSNYVSLYYDLASRPSGFGSYYNFSTAYSLTGVLDTLLAQLDPLLVTDTTKQGLYRGYYYSGHDSSNPITDLNWPVYWCGVGKMAEQDIIDCVNGY